MTDRLWETDKALERPVSRTAPGTHYRNPHGVNMDDGYRPEPESNLPDFLSSYVTRERWAIMSYEERMELQFKCGGIQVASGGAAWPLHMDFTSIDIEDIAHSLSMKVRYTGHSLADYKIAQHCCHVHDLVPEEDRHEALMHDAAEYVLPDVAAPVKHNPEFEAFFKPIEKQAERAIAHRFDLRFPFPPSVKYADNQMAWFEKDKIMAKPAWPWMVWTIPVVEPAVLPNFEVWDWKRAKYEFLTRARRLEIR